MKKIFYNGNIITMTHQKCEAILIENDKIIDIGNLQKFQKIKAIKYNLNGKTLIPAFLDAHSHLSSYANSMLQASLEESTNFNEIKEVLKQFIKENNIKDNEWVIGNSFDDNNIKESKKISKEVLDEISQTNPIVIQHKNGHNGVFNSKAIELLNIETENGILEENEYMKYIEKVPMNNFKDLIASYIKAQNKYLEYGITQIQEGILVKQMIPIYKYLIDNQKLFIDTVVYPNVECFDEFKQLYPQAINNYYNNMKIGGIKIILDGSPQSKTAWMLTPYKDTNDYGYGVMKDEDVYKAIEKAIQENVQIIAHCNGDAAIEQYINNLEKFDIEDIKKIKPVIIHAQLLNKKQLERIKKLEVIPSFFIAHIYHFGDIHIKNFGMERASIISPAKSVLDKNILFTFHQDTPVIEPNILETLWCATNRKTKQKILLGEEEKIDIYEALKAQTINVAYQYNEEKVKGSIEIGKFANFIILDKNILEVKSMDIKDIEILDVIYKGNSVDSIKSK